MQNYSEFPSPKVVSLTSVNLSVMVNEHDLLSRLTRRSYTWSTIRAVVEVPGLILTMHLEVLYVR